jgi:hypothetical protein
MAFEVTSLNPKEPTKAFNMIAYPKTINKQQREKLKRWVIPLEKWHGLWMISIEI